MVPGLCELVAPPRTALLVIDVQAHFDEPGSTPFAVGVPLVVERLARTVAAARAAGAICIFVRAVESERTNTPVWVSRHATKPERVGKYLDGTPGAEFHPRLRPTSGDVTIVKHRYSSFLGTDLDRILRERRIRTLVIGGIATNVCVEMTAAEAFQREYWTIVLSDGTTTTSAEEQHAALRDVQRNWGLVATSDDVITCWSAP